MSFLHVWVSCSSSFWHTFYWGSGRITEIFILDDICCISTFTFLVFTVSFYFHQLRNFLTHFKNVSCFWKYFLFITSVSSFFMLLPLSSPRSWNCHFYMYGLAALFSFLRCFLLGEWWKHRNFHFQMIFVACQHLHFLFSLYLSISPTTINFTKFSNTH